MVDKYLGGTCPARSGEGAVGALDWSDFTSGQVREHLDAMDRFELGRAIEAAMRIIRRVDTYINETQPFKLARDPEESGQVAGILYDCLEAIRIASCLLESTMPARIAELRAAWNLGAASGDLEA